MSELPIFHSSISLNGEPFHKKEELEERLDMQDIILREMVIGRVPIGCIELLQSVSKKTKIMMKQGEVTFLL